ncbi:cytochrome P450 [Lentinula raphanica]|uniref:Cytochrome P450 n=1 Tax=Lentinula raphanica TaxID=153919 RepID=A0AA38UHU3_9AGAR|nr:cytochrome P450 [Lentinula raphanica]
MEIPFSTFALPLCLSIVWLVFLTRRKIHGLYIDVLAIAYSYDLLSSSFRSGENTFHFTIFGNFVVGLRGNDARKIYFNERYFSTSEGYKMFSKAVPVPALAKTLISAEEEHGSHFKKQLDILVNRDRFSEIIATMLGDIQRVMSGWHDEGTLDPFDKINDIAFRVTVHMITSSDFVSDSSPLSRFQDNFFTQLKNNTPAMIFLPWFYRSAQKEKEIAITSLFTTLTQFIEAREKTEISLPAVEPIDLLLAHGLNTQEAIQFIIGFLFGSVFNTTKAISWILIYISIYPQWVSAIRRETENVLYKLSSNPSETLHSRLSKVPGDAWEDSMPTLDLVISETLRLTMNQTAIRRNIGEDVQIPGGKDIVPGGAFTVYSHADAHLNPEIYPEPWSFQPERFEQGKQKSSNDFLGWGAGRHRCVGMRIAKLIIKTVVCTFVVTYDFDIKRRKNMLSSTKTIPVPDYNKVNEARPKGEVITLNYVKRMEHPR